MTPARRLSLTAVVVATTASASAAVVPDDIVAAVAVPTAAQDLALSGAVVLNPADETARQGVLLVRDGQVSAMAERVPPDFPGPTLALDGKFVLPALADVHTHTFGNATAGMDLQVMGPAGSTRAALYNGVAFVLDLFSDERAILAFRDAQRAARQAGDAPQAGQRGSDGTPLGAELLAAGPCFTATNGHCSEYGIPTRIVNTPAEARREVDDLARSRPDVVKVVYDHQSYSGGRRFPTVDLPTLTAVLDAARSHSLKTVVHIGTWQDVRDAALAGADAVTHTPGPEPPPADLPALLAEAGTFHIPTLAVQGDFARIAAGDSFLDDPLLAESVPEAVLASYRDSASWNDRVKAWVAWQRTLAEPVLESVGVLARAGVPMLAGTDGGNFAVFQGYSVHRELALLRAAGLSPWAALRAATTDAAQFLDRRWGVEPGDEATLLVLDASPLEDLAHTTRIHAVVRKGVVVDRESLRTWK